MNNLIISSIRRTLAILPQKNKSASLFLLLGIVSNSIFDLIGLAALLPLLAAILNKNFIHKTPQLEWLYQNFSFSSEKWFIVFICALVFLFFIVKNAFGLWIQKMQIAFSLNAYKQLSKKILRSIYRKGFVFLKDQNSNLLLNRVVTVPQQFSQFLLIQLFLFLNEISILLLIAVSLIIYDYNILFILIITIVPAFTAFYKKTKKRIGQYSEKLNDLGPALAKPVFEIIFGYVDVVIGGVYNHFQRTFLKNVEEAKMLRIKLNVLQQIPNRLIEITVILTSLLLFNYGLFFFEDSEQILALLSVFGLAAYRSIPSINRIILAIINIKGQSFNLNLMEQFLNNHGSATAQCPVTFNNHIKLVNVSFSYEENTKTLLNNINLTINKGESIGLIGKSGSGKTTLMNIMLGFLEQSSGVMMIDNTQLTEGEKSAWQQKIGYVRQDVFLVDGSIKENVAFGIPDDKIDESKVDSAIERAQLQEFVQNLPSKIETQIGERGAKISGGQRQRIGIARALYHEAEILLFDEATSALDDTTEKEITEAIKKLHDENLTMIIIAHRKSTLKYCDRIFEIKNGYLTNNSI